jgi:NitT/TauT family transport system ATP-binding protein
MARSVSTPGEASGVDLRNGAAAVEVRSVGHVFESEDAAQDVEALVDINLRVRRNAFVSLIGPSGCGKSTLLRIIADLIAPSGGSVFMNGRPAATARLSREYGMVFQQPVLFDWRTVAANIELPLQVIGVPPAARADRVRRSLELVELSEFAEHRPWQLSGGMQQRVAIARALVLEPSILLMDEPFGALDEMTRERMNLELNRIWRETGTTVVFVTHSIPEAVFLSTQIVVMSPRPGRVVTTVDVELPTRRTTETRELSRYFDLVTLVRENLRGDEGGRASETGPRVEPLGG